MSNLVVGVADCLVSSDPEAVLATYALGSCIAVVIYDPEVRVAGMLHYMLPDSSMDRAKAQQNPWMFADTGIPLMFRTAYSMGADKRRLLVWAIGGAQFLDDRGVFEIGKRNHLATRKILWKAGVLLHSEAVGGSVHRTVHLEVATGRLWLRCGGEAAREMWVRPAKEAKNGVQRVNCR